MKRALALVERDMRKFRRSPALLFASLMLPLVQLVILGNAFGGNIKNVKMGVVNLDRGPESVDVLERVRAVGANARTFLPSDYDDQSTAVADLRKGVLGGVLIIPQHYSRDLLEQHQPHLALITDNTDRSVAGAIGEQMSSLVTSINAPQVTPREPQQALLDVVEVYPYIDYIKYLLPGSVALAIFVTAMIGGGMLFIDDKSRGLHEGYMVTPITKWELILGFNLSGVIKAVLAGETVLILGAVVARVPDFFEPVRLIELTLMVILTSIALIGMMFFIMVRISDPLVPRAIFGVLNTVLFFPSGAVYPTQAFPAWMKVITAVDPFTYAVHGFKELILKNTGLGATGGDLAYLAGFAILSMAAATLLFRRTL